MRGVGQIDAIESVTFRHAEGNEGEKIGVKRRFGAFYGAKLLKKQGDERHRATGKIAQVLLLDRKKISRRQDVRCRSIQLNVGVLGSEGNAPIAFPDRL